LVSFGTGPTITHNNHRAFGLTVAESYLGFFPFILHPNSSIWDMINHLEKSEEAPFPLEGASDEFKDFVYSTLRFHRKERPSAASLLSHPFITKYQHKKPSFFEKWLYLSYIKPKQMLQSKKQKADYYPNQYHNQLSSEVSN